VYLMTVVRTKFDIYGFIMAKVNEKEGVTSLTSSV
jgi:hypothetical protein